MGSHFLNFFASGYPLLCWIYGGLSSKPPIIYSISRFYSISTSLYTRTTCFHQSYLNCIVLVAHLIQSYFALCVVLLLFMVFVLFFISIISFVFHVLRISMLDFCFIQLFFFKLWTISDAALWLILHFLIVNIKFLIWIPYPSLINYFLLFYGEIFGSGSCRFFGLLMRGEKERIRGKTVRFNFFNPKYNLCADTHLGFQSKPTVA